MTNIGDPDPVALLSATIEGPDADAFHAHLTGLSPIDPHAEVQVKFRPVREGEHLATLTLQTSAPEQAEFAVRLVGNGRMLGTCDLRINAREYNPHDVYSYEIGRNDDIRIRHKGGPPCVVSNYRFEGPDADWYRIIHLSFLAWGDNPCGFNPVSDRFKSPDSPALLQANNRCHTSVDVDIYPIAPNPRPLHAVFRFDLNGETRSLNVMTPSCCTE